LSSAEFKVTPKTEEEDSTPWKFRKLSDDEYDALVNVSCKVGFNMTKLPEYIQRLMSEFNNMADTLSSYDVMEGMFRIIETGTGSTSLDIKPGMYDKIKANTDNKMFTVRTRSDMKTLLRMADLLTELKQLNWAVATGNYEEIRRLTK